MQGVAQSQEEGNIKKRRNGILKDFEIIISYLVFVSCVYPVLSRVTFLIVAFRLARPLSTSQACAESGHQPIAPAFIILYHTTWMNSSCTFSREAGGIRLCAGRSCTGMRYLQPKVRPKTQKYCIT